MLKYFLLYFFQIYIMKFKSRLKFFTILLAFLFASAGIVAAQTIKTAAPRQEKLLNGMKLLVWNAPAAPKVSVKLRIHSGAAFDTLGKEGTMAMLAEILFPTEAAKEFFAEDLGGSLDITSNYDYIQIDATANDEQLLTMLETLANAVINVQTDKETTAKVRAAQLEKIKELEKNPVYIADRAVAKRLFGDFPYGRPQMGTSQSIAKIDFADLTLAKQRFFTADNATLAVVGSIKPDLVYRAARRFFGSWTQADKKIPATFRQPEAPENKTLTIEVPNLDKSYNRAAVNAAARNDKDFYATQIVSNVRRSQLCYTDESKRGELKYEPHLLRGIYIIRRNENYVDKVEELPINDRNPCAFLLVKNDKFIYPAITQKDFEAAKSKAIAEMREKMTANPADLWLDADTFKLISVKDEMSRLDNVTFADVQKVAEDLQKQPVANVTVKKTESIKSN